MFHLPCGEKVDGSGSSRPVTDMYLTNAVLHIGNIGDADVAGLFDDADIRIQYFNY
jgi:hypothetical protein